MTVYFCSQKYSLLSIMHEMYKNKYSNACAAMCLVCVCVCLSFLLRLRRVQTCKQSFQIRLRHCIITFIWFGCCLVIEIFEIHTKSRAYYWMSTATIMLFGFVNAIFSVVKTILLFRRVESRILYRVPSCIFSFFLAATTHNLFGRTAKCKRKRKGNFMRCWVRITIRNPGEVCIRVLKVCVR